MTLNCTANQVENLITPPIITWIAPDSSEVPTLREGSTTRVAVVNPQTKQLIFTDLMASSRGAYTCRAIINISEAQIDNHFDETSIEVNTARKSLVLVVICLTSNDHVIL